jgi:hypothetical protein
MLGCSKVFSLLVEPDVDTVLCEEFTFSSSIANGQAKGAKFYPIKMDDGGLIPSELERVLSSWDEGTQGRRPHLLYTIPCGQVSVCGTLASHALTVIGRTRLALCRVQRDTMKFTQLPRSMMLSCTFARQVDISR